MVDRRTDIEEAEMELEREYAAGEPEADQLIPVRARSSRTARNVFSLRIGAEELDAIADAAELRGVSVGDFIRKAAVKEAHGDSTSAKLDQMLALLREALSQGLDSSREKTAGGRNIAPAKTSKRKLARTS